MAARTMVGPSNPQTQFFTAFLLVLLMLFMGTSSLYTPQEALSNEESEAPANGRQGGLSIEDECEGLKFEDLFDYDFADFKVYIGDDWATAEMDAGAFVNGSNPQLYAITSMVCLRDFQRRQRLHQHR